MSGMSRKWFLVTLTFAVMVGAIGGGAIGGVIGYVAAENARPEPIVVSQAQAPLPTSPPATTNTTQVVDEESAIIAAVQKVEPSVVLILNQGRQSGSSGSGVIVSEDGYIVTNNHVVEGAVQLRAVFNDGREVAARLIGTYPASDLAVIKVEEAVPAVAELGDSDSLRLGSRVIAIGSALGRFQNTVTTGIVSGLGRQLGGINGLIQTDASINHGNSGGPLFNLAGQIVGINTLVVRDGGSSGPAEGLGFSIPSNVVRAVSQQLIATGSVERAYIGIRYRGLQTDEANRLDMPVGSAALVESVTEGGPAARAGLQAGDIILAVDGSLLNTSSSLPTLMFSLRPGQNITLDVVRGEQTGELSLTLGDYPA